MSPDARSPYRPLVVTGVLLTITFLLYVARTVCIPIALGILLTFILTPAVGLLQARGLRRTNAVLIVVFCAVVIIGGLLTALTIQLRDLARDLPEHKGH